MYIQKWVIFIVISIIIFSCLSYENKNEDNGVNIIDSFYSAILIFIFAITLPITISYFIIKDVCRAIKELLEEYTFEVLFIMGSILFICNFFKICNFEGYVFYSVILCAPALVVYAIILPVKLYMYICNKINKNDK